jgi:hypothetical protein
MKQSWTCDVHEKRQASPQDNILKHCQFFLRFATHAKIEEKVQNNLYATFVKHVKQ